MPNLEAKGKQKRKAIEAVNCIKKRGFDFVLNHTIKHDVNKRTLAVLIKCNLDKLLIQLIKLVTKFNINK